MRPSAPGTNGRRPHARSSRASVPIRGEDLILRQNLFIEYLLPLRHISEEAIEVYRRHYRNPGPSRMPMLTWTRDLPIAGEPADVVAIVEDYAQWLSTSPIPKLFIDADPGGFLIGAPRGSSAGLAEPGDRPGQGRHFLQEEAPDEVGRHLHGSSPRSAPGRHQVDREDARP